MHTTTRLLTSLGYVPFCVFFFFFNDTATTEIYTLSLHDALPISPPLPAGRCHTPARKRHPGRVHWVGEGAWPTGDRKSTRLNSSHTVISYAVFCLKKKKDISSVACAQRSTLR